MAYEYREPDVVETHTHRETVVDRTDGSGAGWAVVLVLAVLVVLGLVGYFAFAGGGDRGSDTQVRVDVPAAERAQDIQIDTPDVNVAPPNVNVAPPDVNIETPSVTPPTTNEGSSTTEGGE